MVGQVAVPALAPPFSSLSPLAGRSLPKGCTTEHQIGVGGRCTGEAS